MEKNLELSVALTIAALNAGHIRIPRKSKGSEETHNARVASIIGASVTEIYRHISTAPARARLSAGTTPAKRSRS
jgi:hypothetical protein